ncbi:uncharacterized protein LOC144468387 [Augochlora pura]
MPPAGKGPMERSNIQVRRLARIKKATLYIRLTQRRGELFVAARTEASLTAPTAWLCCPQWRSNAPYQFYPFNENLCILGSTVHYSYSHVAPHSLHNRRVRTGYR